MTHGRLIIGVSVLTLSLSGCGRVQARHTASEVEHAKHAVEAVEAEMLDAFHDKDASRLTLHYSSDAIVATPLRPMAKGTEAIRRVNAADMADPNYSLHFVNKQTDIADSGDLAYTRGTFKLTWTDPKTNRPVDGEGTYVTVFRKQEDGSWKAVVDIASPSA